MQDSSSEGTEERAAARGEGDERLRPPRLGSVLVSITQNHPAQYNPSDVISLPCWRPNHDPKGCNNVWGRFVGFFLVGLHMASFSLAQVPVCHGLLHFASQPTKEGNITGAVNAAT